jgi:hypothetical protein
MGANSTHGLKRSNADKRHAVRAMLEDSEWSQWSNHEIARACGCSHTLVNALRNDEAPPDPVKTRVMKRGGKEIAFTPRQPYKSAAFEEGVAAGRALQREEDACLAEKLGSELIARRIRNPHIASRAATKAQIDGLIARGIRDAAGIARELDLDWPIGRVKNVLYGMGFHDIQ